MSFAHERQQLSTLWRLYMQAEENDREREKAQRIADQVAEYILTASDQLYVALDALQEISALGDDRFREAGGIAHLALAQIERALTKAPPNEEMCETCDRPATRKVFDDILACDECAGWHRDAGR